MNQLASQKGLRTTVLATAPFVLWVLFVSYAFGFVEVGIKELSPQGELGGYAVPASGSSLACTLSVSPAQPITVGNPLTLSWSAGANGPSAMQVEYRQETCSYSCRFSGCGWNCSWGAWQNLGNQNSGFQFTPTADLKHEFMVSGIAPTINTDGHSVYPPDQDNWSCSRQVDTRLADLASLNLQLASGAATIPLGVSVNFTADVKNVGDRGAVAFDDRFRFRYGNNSYTTISTVAKTGLAAGATSQDVSSSRTFNTTGTVTVEHCVDFNNDVGESSNANNCSTRQYQVVAPSPDLVPQATTTIAGGGTTRSFSNAVTNVGYANATNAFTNRFEIDLDRNGSVDVTLSGADVDKGSLAQGASSPFSSNAWTITPGDHQVRAVVDYNSQVNEGSPAAEGNNTSPWTPFTVQTVFPDLTSQNLSVVGGDTTLTVGQTATITAQAANIGSTTASGNFTDRFQISSNNGASWTPLNAIGRSDLAVGATVLDSTSWQFVTPGTYLARHCVDTNSEINESDETNNCTATSSYLSFVVDPPPVAPTVTCSASPNPVFVNNPAVWTAVPTGGTAPYTYAWTGADSLTGNATTTTKTYSTTGSKSASVNVMDALGLQSGYTACTSLAVNATVATPPTANLQVRIAVPGGTWWDSGTLTITEGQQIELQWSSVNASVCSGDAYYATGNAVNGLTATVVEPTVAQSPRTYTLTCSGPGGTTTDSVNVTAIAATSNPVVNTCTVSPNPVGVNTQVLWNAEASGGTTPYTWEWTFDGVVVSGGGLGQQFRTYGSAGPKTTSVRVRDWNNLWSAPYTCPTLTVVAGALPDLTTLAPHPVVLPSAAGPGATLTLYSTTTSAVVGTGVAFQNKFEVDLYHDGTIDQVITTGNLGPLAAGGSVQSSAGWGSIIGQHRIRAVADGNSTVPESDEDNNVSPWTDIWIVANGSSDFTSSGFRTTNSTTSVAVNTPFAFRGQVNAAPMGNGGQSGVTFYDYYEWRPQGGSWVKFAEFSAVHNFLSFGPLETTNTIQFATPGVYEFRHYVDALNNVVERNEANNYSAVWTVTVTGPVSVGGGSGVCSVSPSAVDIGDTVTWSATATGGTAPYSYQWEIDGVVGNWGSSNSTTTSYASDGIKSARIRVQDVLGIPTGWVSCTSQVTVNPPPPLPTVTLEAQNVTDGTGWSGSDLAGPTAVDDTDSVEMRWDSTDADECTNTFVPGTATANAGVAITIPAPGDFDDYTIVCTNNAGASPQDTIRVATKANPGQPTLSGPARVTQCPAPGSSADLTANANGQSGCVVSGPGISNTPLTDPFAGDVIINVPQVCGESTYRLQCPGTPLNPPGYDIPHTIRILPSLEEI